MAANPESILDSVKHVLGLDADYTAFDIDVLIHINSAFGNLQQLGVGADTGFVISDNTTLWVQYCTELTYLGMVKQYICMAVKLAFDPPATGFGTDAIRKQLDELQFRINVAAEHTDPPSDPFAIDKILDYIECGTVFEGGVMPSYFAPKVVVLQWETVVTPDAKTGNVYYLELTGDCTINAPVNGVDGEHLTLGVTSNGHLVTWGNGWNFGDGGIPELTSGKTDIISGVYKESSTEWFAGYTPGF